ncbi:MAG: NAD(P)H-hydrate dehydratase [Steroidobacteraceae bacterium]
MNLPRDLYRVAQVREVEAAAIACGTPGYELMQRAAAAAQRVLQMRWPQARRVALLCGGGNNGGDGLVLARLLAAQGIAATVLTAFQPPQLRGEAAAAWKDLQGQGACIRGCSAAELAETFATADVVVDALLGIGVRAPLSPQARNLIDALNGCARPVLALDLPSGLDPDSGAALPAVRATATVSFLALKQGAFLGDGPESCGELHFDALGVTPAVPASLRRIVDSDLAGFLPPRRRDAHKAEFGRVLVVGGGEGMAGAARLAGEAALRVGAGLVTVASLPQHAAMITGTRPELMFRGVEDAARLAAMLPQFDVVAVGPGLGQQPWGEAMLDAVLSARLPHQRLVVDADALNLLARGAPMHRDDWVLTPHPGEAARLLGVTGQVVQQDRPAALEKLVRQRGGVVVLKGAGTLIGAAEATLICDRGNPGMAVPGMGDVLTGALAGLLAQRREPLAATAAAVFLHATAGDRCAQAGRRGILALEVATELRAVLAQSDP